MIRHIKLYRFTEPTRPVSVEGIDRVDKFKYFGSVVSEDLVSSSQIKVRTATKTKAFNMGKRLLSETLDLELRRRFAICFVWSVANEADTWTLCNEDHKRIETFEI